MSPGRGRFVTFEGGEGAGKSTQIRLLAAWLAERGVEARVTREPGGTPGAERIRALLVEGEAGDWTPMTEALLNYAARREHVARVIAPALAAGQWVLSDRFADSTMAYQGFGHGLGRKAIEALHRAAIGRLAPDLTIILDIPVREGLARAAARRGREDRYENMEAGFHERVRRGFRAIARRETRRCVLLDARLPPEALQEEIRSVVARRLARALAR